MHELTRKIMKDINLSSYLDKALDKIIVSWLEEKVLESNQKHLSLSEDYKECKENRRTFGLPEKKSLEEEIALVIKQKEFPESKYVGEYDLDTAKRIIAFLKSRGVEI